MADQRPARGAAARAADAPTRERSPDHQFAIGTARAFGGAVIFALPLFMTMEMWWLGFHMAEHRLALLLVVLAPLLLVLSRYAGFRRTFDLREDALDAAAAFAIGTIASAAVLALFAVIGRATPPGEIAGKVAIQIFPASIGALLAQSQFGHRTGGDDAAAPVRGERYGRELFLMAVGAIFLGLNLAPTEEMVLIQYRMSEWHSLAAVLVSVAGMHAFVYALEFRGQEHAGPDVPAWSVFARYTIVGYVIALAISAYLLWTFGRFDGVELAERVRATIVLGVPSAIGAAAARLIL